MSLSIPSIARHYRRYLLFDDLAQSDDEIARWIWPQRQPEQRHVLAAALQRRNRPIPKETP
uniref:Uncharacterized protein n=1 Tax=viral metagenome TaxID=1070528 RepID=A0A6M3Y6S7_9ZZZZ